MRYAAVLAVFFAVAPTGAWAQPDVRELVPVYDATQIAFDSYTVLKRLPVERSKSAFRVSGHADEQRARRALLNEAAALGADAVVNLYCLGQTDAVFRPAGYYCYGNAIKLRK